MNVPKLTSIKNLDDKIYEYNYLMENKIFTPSLKTIQYSVQIRQPEIP